MQDELAKAGIQGQNQLVLGFDAGCFTCSDLAARIEERVGEKLAVRNLHDPEVQAWRTEALGEDAKWTPTLFKIEDGKVKAWAGWRMGWALSRTLGPATTWQVMQALGDVGAAPRFDGSSIAQKLPEQAGEVLTGISRARFLKGLTGLAVATSATSGVGLLGIPAVAAAKRRKPDLVKSRRVTGSELIKMARDTAKNLDVRKVAGDALSTNSKIEAAKPQAFVNTLRDGNVVRSVVYKLSKNRYIAHYGLSRVPKPGGARSVAKVYVHERGKNTIVKASEGGRFWRKKRSKSSRSQSEGVVSPKGCPPIGGGQVPGADCSITHYECCSWSLAAPGCKIGIAAGTVTCAGCLLGIVGAAFFAGFSAGGSVVIAAATLGLTCASCLVSAGATIIGCCAEWQPVYKCSYNA